MVPVLATGVIVIVLVAANREAAVSPLFGETLRQHTNAIGGKAGVYQNLLTQIATVDRVELVRITDEALEPLSETETLLRQPSFPIEMAGVLAILSEAVGAWSGGVVGLRDSLLAAADDNSVLGVEESVADALIDLRSGDRLHAAFLTSVAGVDTAQPVSPYPEVGFLPLNYPFSSAAGHLVSITRAPDNLLELRSTVAIGPVTTEPELLIDSEQNNVVTGTDILVVMAVIENRGNVVSEPSSVRLQLFGGDDSLAIELSAPLGSLEAGASTTITFDQVAVTPGASYRLVVQLSLADGDAETEDNTRALIFRVNAETSDPTSTESTTAGN